ncbi:MAG: GDP-mannose 4,6-dehydratase [Candidatus Nanoarchaeia archaeon]
MANILVTGGAGFIGSHVCEALLDRGDSVVCIDDFNDYYSPELKHKNLERITKNPRFHLVVGDIRDIAQLQNIFEETKPDKVIHLAARAGVRASIKDPLLYQEVNVSGTLNLLELARQYDIKNFVYASSSSVYGENKTMPFSEKDRVDNPLSPYAATKRAAELMCSTYHHMYGMNISCLRFFTVYGPRGRPDMAPYKFMDLVMHDKPIPKFGDGSSSRDYTYVNDIVQGIFGALDGDFGFEIFNLGNSAPVSLNDFISTMERVTGKKAEIDQKPVPSTDVPATYADLSKSRRLLGYDPKIGLEDGLTKMFEWYKKERMSRNK